MGMNRNERKVLVLGLLVPAGSSLVSRDLVNLWGLTPSGAQSLLEKYRHQSLISREREPGSGPPVYRYSITPTGLRKAGWLALQMLRHPPGQERLPGWVEPEEPELRGIRPPTRLRGPERGIRPQTHLRGD